MLWALGLHPHGIFIGTGDNVSAAAEHRLQRFRASIEMLQFDIDAGGIEIAEPLREHDRQEIHLRGRTRHRDDDLRLFGRLRLRKRDRHQ
jgi:hypothetical protein